MRQPSTILILLLLATYSFADVLHRTSHQDLQGVITNSTDSTVTIRQQNIYIISDKTHIISYEFSRADIIILTDSSLVTCKIVDVKGDSLVYTSEIGVSTIHKKIIESIKYNSGVSLAVNSLPSTGDQFINQLAKLPDRAQFSPGMYLKAGVGVHYANTTGRSPLSEPSSQVPPNYISGVLIGAEIGYNIHPSFRMGIGSELFSSEPFNWLTKERVTSYSYIFHHLSVRLHFPLQGDSNIHYYLGASAGMLKNRENISISSGSHYKTHTEAAGYRLRAGVLFHVKAAEYSIDCTYLFTESSEFTYDDDRIGVDFSGFGVAVGLSLPVPGRSSSDQY